MEESRVFPLSVGKSRISTQRSNLVNIQETFRAYLHQDSYALSIDRMPDCLTFFVQSISDPKPVSVHHRRKNHAARLRASSAIFDP
jgi:hypothetical protein